MSDPKLSRLGAAMEPARTILAEDRLLRLAPHEIDQLEKALDDEPHAFPQLAALITRFGATGPVDV